MGIYQETHSHIYVIYIGMYVFETFIWSMPKYFNPFSTGKIEKLDFWDANNCENVKHQ